MMSDCLIHFICFILGELYNYRIQLKRMLIISPSNYNMNVSGRKIVDQSQHPVHAMPFTDLASIASSLRAIQYPTFTFYWIYHIAWNEKLNSLTTKTSIKFRTFYFPYPRFTSNLLTSPTIQVLHSIPINSR